MARPSQQIFVTLFLAFVVGVFVSPRMPASTVALNYYTHSIHVNGTERQVRVPEGYRLELVTTELRGPRMISIGPAGELLIGSKSGLIYRLAQPYREVEVLARVGGYPHSLLVRDDELFVARTDGVYAIGYTSGNPLDMVRARTVATLPSGPGHNTRTIALGPDGRIFVSLGISSNCSEQFLGEPYAFDQRRGGVLVLNETVEPPVWETFASGLRNPVGFDWHPGTGVMYASNNGPDHLGYENPREYFSKLAPGSFHGMPWFQYDGERLRRDGCASGEPPLPIGQVAVPVATFPARNAPMAVGFIPIGAMDPSLEGDAVVALRGSWGTLPSGSASGDPATRREPKLVVVRFESGVAARVDDLVTGFQLENGKRWARPVGAKVGPDGALYFTSDEGVNSVFRLVRLK